MDRVSRRAVLASLPAVGAGLAGCPSSGLSRTATQSSDTTTDVEDDCDFGTTASRPEDTLGVSVTDVQYGQQYTATVGVSNAVEYKSRTRYRDVAFYAYNTAGCVTRAVEIGDVEPGATREREVSFPAFPFVVTANVSGYEHVRDCYRADNEAEVRGYAGFYDDGSRRPRKDGHVWVRLGDRRLPKDGSVTSTAPRLHRSYFAKTNSFIRDNRRSSNLESPTFPVPLDRTWLEDQAFRDGNEKRVTVSYLGAADQSLVEKRMTPVSTVDRSELPTQFETAIETDAMPEVGFEEGLSLVGSLTGTSIESTAELPSCYEDNVSCENTELHDCTIHGKQYARGLAVYRAWFFTDIGGSPHAFRIQFVYDL